MWNPFLDARIAWSVIDDRRPPGMCELGRREPSRTASRQPTRVAQLVGGTNRDTRQIVPSLAPELHAAGISDNGPLSRVTALSFRTASRLIRIAAFPYMFVPEGEPPRNWAERLYNIRCWRPSSTLLGSGEGCGEAVQC
jgi:hypothetical protein